MKISADMSAPVRIAQILGKMEGGGVEQVVMNYYRHIDRSKIQFDFFVFDSSSRVPEAEIESLGGRVFRLCELKNAPRYIKTLTALLTENKYSIVHCHLSTLSGPALKAAKRAGVPIRIIHNHTTSGGKREFVRNLAKAVLKPFCGKNATHRFACSRYAAEWLYGKKPVCDLSHTSASKESVYILRNAVDGSVFARDEEKRISLREELGIPHNALVFGHIGRFCPQKSQSFLVDIFSEILKIQPNSYLLMAGTGGDVELIRNKITEMKLSDRALLLGQRSDTDRLYNAFDCFVLPSNYEGLGMVGVEAQAVGVGCVFSDRVPTEVKFSDGASFVSLKCSLKDWAKAVLNAVKNAAAPADLAAQGYEISVEAERLADFYLKATEELSLRKEET
ncbi:MAG: glycosyltransferase family 1 protein [Ruminococcaceae bacterium]|nr:glycosyltransferase family 1 protein [Oscillospiraceae bacterium]